ncbi:MAG: Rha family transcriptional regulator [Lachnospiraceae bacterium]|nr:Rha family transcriptional regulator [Lachnospiraceae bacterium]
MLIEVMKINKKEVNVVTSLDIAETFGKQHKDVLESIRGIREAISTAEFSALFYETTYKATNGKNNPMYHMNRDGFTLLVMGYTGEKAMRFKLAYIKQFNAMEELLKGKLIEREKGIAVRQAFTKTIQLSGENDRMHGHAYSTYTNAIYKAMFEKNANQLREEYGISKKDDLRNYFSTEELQSVQSAEMLVSSLINCGWGYDQIKDFVIQNVPKQIGA